MFKKLGRRFYSAKYVYAIHFHSVNPWFMHEKPATVGWKRGSKKHKKGQTSPHMPVHVASGSRKTATLDVEEGFELGVTLYAENNRTKRTGPYGTKELKLVISEVDGEGEIYSVLGALTVNLNEYAGLVDHRIRAPVQVDDEIIAAVGQPYIDISIKSWYQATGGTSISSGISSTGFSIDAGTSHGSGSDEEEDSHLTMTGNSQLDPVRPLDSADVRKAGDSFLVDSIPDHIKTDEVSVQNVANIQQDKQAAMVKEEERPSAVNMQSTDDSQEATSATTATESLSAVETDKNNADGEEDFDKEAIAASPVAVAVEELAAAKGNGLPDEASLITVGVRYKRLSTINSDIGEEVLEMEKEQDELNKFLAAQNPDSFGFDAVVDAATTVENENRSGESKKKAESQRTPADDSAREERPVEMATAVSNTTSKNKTADAGMYENKTHTDKMVAVETTSQTVDQGAPTSEVSTSTTINNKQTPSTPIKEAKESKKPERRAEAAYSRIARPASRRRGCWVCLPGSGLVCCQPALPRES